MGVEYIVVKKQTNNRQVNIFMELESPVGVIL